jgi:hypothetical protein
MEEWNNGKTEIQKDGRTEEWPKLFLPNIPIFHSSILPIFFDRKGA